MFTMSEPQNIYETGRTCKGDSDLSSQDTQDENEEQPWDKFANWIHCVCVVTFDLELGQAIEVSFSFLVYLN